jgi:Uma2 family endonuclease
MTVDDYLRTGETNRPRELRRGIVREPPAPYFSHQQVVLRVARILSAHVEAGGFGHVVISPIDVVLDRDNALVVQPDVLFVATDRASIIHDQIWGAPDLVVEVLSPGTQSHERGEKLGWYRQYGVRECWLIDAFLEELVVVNFTGALPERQVARGQALIPSRVFGDLQVPVAVLFE